MKSILNACTRPEDYSRAQFFERGGADGVHQSMFKAAAQVDLLKGLLSEGCPPQLALEILAETNSTAFVVKSRYDYEKQVSEFQKTLQRALQTERDLRLFMDTYKVQVTEVTACVEQLCGEMNTTYRQAKDRRKHKRKIMKDLLAIHERLRVLVYRTKAPSADGAQAQVTGY